MRNRRRSKSKIDRLSDGQWTGAHIKLYAKGSSGSPGGSSRCGWAFILLHGDSEESSSFGEDYQLTNNRSDVLAVIYGLQAAISSCGPAVASQEIGVYSDSDYVVNSINRWVVKWKASGWMRWERGVVAEVKHRDLWEMFLHLKSKVGRIAASFIRREDSPVMQRVAAMARDARVTSTG